MSYAAIATLVLVGIIVVALACYLLTILAILWRIGSTLGNVASRVRAIASHTEPIGPAVEDTNGNLGAVADSLEELVARAASAPVTDARR